MAFEILEESREQGQPISLYSFALQGTVWRYASVDSDVVAGGFTWKASAISDDGVKQTGEAMTDGLTITAPTSIGPVQVHMQTPPASAIKVRIYVKDVADPEIVCRYAGDISQVDFPTPGIATISCDTLSASMRQQGLRLGWQRTCPYAVYDTLTCKVNKADFAINALVINQGGGSVVVQYATSVADNYLDGGFIEWQHPVRGYESRMIEQQSGNLLMMFGPSDDIYPGTRVVAYPGCNLTRDDCINKFNNLPNNGAFSLMPGVSPFDGNPVF